MTDPSATSEAGSADQLVAAACASVLIILGGVWYWTVQVQDMLALLELAYGPGWGLERWWR